MNPRHDNKMQQQDQSTIFVHNLLDAINNTGQPQDIIDFFLHIHIYQKTGVSKPMQFINKVYSELQSRFLKKETNPLCKLLIIHFFKYTQSIQPLIEFSREYADNFVSFIPLKRWQTALEFRAFSNLIPSISAIANPLNPEIRNDALSIMRMIKGLESTDPEVFDSAKDALQKLGRKVTPFQNIYLQCIKMPFLLLFLPDMISNSEIINQAINVYSSLFEEFVQKKLEYELHQTQKEENKENEENEQNDQNDQQLTEIEDTEKDHIDASYEHPCEFLHDILVSVIQFIRNLKVFPRTLFSSFIELFNTIGQQEEKNEADHTIAIEACIMIFDAFSRFPEYLRPYQINRISDISINFIISKPAEFKQTFSNTSGQDPSLVENSIDDSDKKILKSPLKMLSRFKVTDSRLTTIPPVDVDSAALLVSVYPRPSSESETNNSVYADQAVTIIKPFMNSIFSIKTCRLFLRHLIDFIPFMSEEAHSILIEVLLPKLMKQGPKHQEMIATFLSSISFQSNPDLLQTYLIFVNYFPKDVQVTPRLKAVCLSLFYLANQQPDASLTSISVTEVFECGKALFLIGEYGQPSRIWGKASTGDSESSSTNSYLVAPAEAFQILALAETYSNAKDHSRAAREFIRAADAFELTSFQHDFHRFYLKGRHFFESICFQVELMNEALGSILKFQGQDSQKEPLSANICDIQELRSSVLTELEGSSLLLHPYFDDVSASLVREFIEIVNEMIEAIDQGPQAFEFVVNNRKIKPPPAILSTEQPITVENVRIVNPDIDIKGSMFCRHFYLELKGNVTYNLKFFKDDLDEDQDEDVFENERSEIEKEVLWEIEKKRNTRRKNNDDFYFYRKNEGGGVGNAVDSNFSPNYERRGVEWFQNSGMKLMCHVSIPINGNMEVVHTQEIPYEGEFSVDFPIFAEHKNYCIDGCKSDSGHNMKVTIFFTAVYDDPNNTSHYRIGREERFVYIHEL